MDDKATIAGSDIGEFDGVGVCGPKDDIGAAGVQSIGTGVRRPDDQISEAIAVDITSRAD